MLVLWRTLFIALLLISSSAVAACLQAPERTRACPNKLYRAAQFPGMEQAAVICICVSDFMPLLAEAKSPEEKLAQYRLKQRFKEQLKHDVEPVLEIIRRAR